MKTHEQVSIDIANYIDDLTQDMSCNDDYSALTIGEWDAVCKLCDELAMIIVRAVIRNRNRIED